MEHYILLVEFDTDDRDVVDSIVTVLNHTLPYMADNVALSMATDA